MSVPFKGINFVSSKDPYFILLKRWTGLDVRDPSVDGDILRFPKNGLKVLFILASIMFLVPFLLSLIDENAFSEIGRCKMPFLHDYGYMFIYVFGLPAATIGKVYFNDSINYHLFKLYKAGSCNSIPAILTQAQILADKIMWYLLAILIAFFYNLPFNIYLFSGNYFGWQIDNDLASKMISISGVSFVVFTFIWSYLISLLVVSVIIWVFISRKISLSDLEINPFVPDECGGLSPIGKVNTSIGIMILIFTIVCVSGAINVYLNNQFVDRTFRELSVAAILIPLLMAPCSFFIPSSFFVAKMRTARNSCIEAVISKIQALTGKAGNSSDYSQDDLNTLIQIYNSVSGMGSWPFDYLTLRTFMAIVLSPILWLIAPIALEKIITGF